MNIYSEDLILLKALYQHKQIELYNLHLDYKLSPAQIHRSSRKFINLELCIIENDSILILEKGLEWIEANRKDIFLKSYTYPNRFDKQLSEIKQLEINSLYKPNIKKIDKRLFKEDK